MRGCSRDCPRTQLSRAASQSGLLVTVKGGILVGLKQAILPEGLVVVLVVGGRGMRSRVVRARDCDVVGVKGWARMKGSRRVVSKRRGCIVMEYLSEIHEAEGGSKSKIAHAKEEITMFLFAPRTVI